MASIIVIDDQVFQREFCRDILVKDGHSVTAVATGTEALDRLGENDFDLALVDLVLEEESGLEVCQEIMKSAPEMPVIIMTASPSLVAAIESIRQGVYDFLVKPLNRDMVFLSVQRALERKRLIEEKNKLINQLMDSNRLLSSFQKITVSSLSSQRPSSSLRRTLRGIKDVTGSAGGAFLMKIPGLRLSFPFPSLPEKDHPGPGEKDLESIHEGISTEMSRHISPPPSGESLPVDISYPGPLMFAIIDDGLDPPGVLVLWRHEGGDPYSSVDLSILESSLKPTAFFLKAHIRQNRMHKENRRLSRQVTDSSNKMSGIQKDLERLLQEVEKEKTMRSEAIQRLEMINRIGQEIGSFVDIESHIERITNLCMQTLGAERISLMLYDEEGDHLYIKHGRGLPTGVADSTRVKKGTGISGWVFENNEPLFIQDVEKDPHFRKFNHPQYTTNSLISAPIRLKGRAIGVLNINNKNDGSPFTREDLDLLVFVSNEVGVGIENTMLYEDVQESYFETIRALIKVLEAKDEATKGHSERVTFYCLAIAEEMGLSAQKKEILKQAGILHDLGKVMVDLSVLRKEGKLSAEEYDLVQQHPTVAAEIIKPMKYMREVQNCIQQHHERHDGQGYPMGIKDMCSEARILSVADAYDAMTTLRPYRPPMSRDAAVEELLRCSGSQFDPDVVTKFVKLVDSDSLPPPEAILEY
jgi:putative nucleotidyltransferase with HDIG domain